jgi:hypothetical protein
VVFSPQAGLAENCKNNFYIISLKDSYAMKKYKVRAFFVDPGLSAYFYGIPKIPKGWHYSFNDERSIGLVAAAETDREAVDIEYFKDFLTIYKRNEKTIYDPYEQPNVSMELICNEPDGTAKVLELKTKDFEIKRIHKGLKEF